MKKLLTHVFLNAQETDFYVIQQSFQISCSVKVNKLEGHVFPLPTPSIIWSLFGLLERQRCSVCSIFAAGRVVPGAWRLHFILRFVVMTLQDLQCFYVLITPFSIFQWIHQLKIISTVFWFHGGSFGSDHLRSHSPGHLWAPLSCRAFLKVRPEASCTHHRGTDVLGWCWVSMDKLLPHLPLSPLHPSL